MVPLYVLSTVVLTYPMAVRAATELPYYTSDIWIFLWDNWWFRTALSTGQSLFFTPDLFYPTGAGLASHSTSFTFSVVAASLRPLGGELFAYNVATLLIFPLGAWGAYLLVLDRTRRPDASFVAGLVYAFAPYHLTHALGHPHLASVQWMPFTALFLTRLMRDGRRRDAVGAGVTFALTLWSGLHLASLGAMWAAGFVLWTLLSDRAARRPAVVRGLALAAVLVLVLCSPAIVALLAESRQVGGLGALLLNRRETGQTDLLAYVVPPKLHPLVGGFVAPVYEIFIANGHWIPYLGAVPLALAIAAGLRQRSAALFWWVSGILWIVLSLGSVLRMNGQVYPSIHLPFELLDQRFPFNTLRYADRFNILVPLSLAVLVGMGLSSIRRRAAVVALGAVIVGEYLCVPIPMRPPRPIPAFALEMREDGERYAVVDFPIGEYFAKFWMFQQITHGKPLVDGHVSRIPPGAYDFIDGIPLLRAVRDPAAPPPSDIGSDLCRLEEAGVRYVLIHPDLASVREVERWASWFETPPTRREENLIVYATAEGCRGRDQGPPR